MFKKKPTIPNRLEVVLEIHHKMKTASEESMKFAESVISSIDLNKMQKYEKLAQKGFGNAQEVKDYLKEFESVKLNIEKQKIIKSYSDLYQQKFILTEDLLKICKEYNLVIGPEKYYSGSIPERVIDNILNFKLRKEHIIFSKGTARITKMGIEKSQAVWEWTEITEEEYNLATNHGKNLRPKGDRLQYITNEHYFMMVAPQSMFKHDDLVFENGVLKEIIWVDDPGCLKPVKYGFLIVDLWGEEAAIQAMQNPKLN